MRSPSIAILIGMVLSHAATAGEPVYPPAKVSFDDFKQLVSEVESHRAKHLIDFDTFLKMAKEPGVVVLDARSAERFARIHVRGAVNLPFTDFTQKTLASVIPTFETKVLIYCNNNFDGNQVDFASKVALPATIAASPVESQLANQARPVMLALNIPTYINLYGYGYRNVYELNELVNVKDPRVTFEGTTVAGKGAGAPPAKGDPAPQPAPEPGATFELRLGR